jgi:DnaJ-class molecular chaperone
MNTENRHNYYEILEINENATQQEIYMAYSKAKMTYSAENKALHSVFSAKEANELRNLVDEAYEVLSNNTYRNIYEKRVMANTFTEDDLSIEAIKKASENLFKRATPQEFIESAPAEKSPAKDLDFEKDLAQKKEWSGADLKKVRQYRDLSFDELTDITKINPWYIAALEEMDPASLPVEVFVRGYVIQISKALGLNEKIVADSYMRLFRKKIES